MTGAPHRLYGDLASCWPLLAPPEEQAEAAGALRTLVPAGGSLLELGSGSGALASHLPADLEVVLVDRSPEMLAVSRQANPGRRHVQADLRALSLGRRFDLVLLHDAVMYLVDDGDLETVLAVAAAHLAPGGRVVVVPDVVEEDFTETVLSGTGEDPATGRACVLTEWHWDPAPGDGRSRAEMTLMMRAPGQPVCTVHESHELLLRSRGDYWAALSAAGLRPDPSVDPIALMPLGQPFVARLSPKIEITGAARG